MSTARPRHDRAADGDPLEYGADFFALLRLRPLHKLELGRDPAAARVLVLASQPGRLNATGVAEALGVHLSSASRICDRLVQAGLLDRRDLPQDRRHVELTLTPAGERLLASVNDHREVSRGFCDA